MQFTSSVSRVKLGSLISAVALGVFSLELFPTFAADPVPPTLTFSLSNSQPRLQWMPYPAAEEYQVLSATNLLAPFSNDSSGILLGESWSGNSAGPSKFFRVGV